MFNGRLNKRPEMKTEQTETSIFSHPDYTVGFGISPNPV
ncbi:hypothetical protein B4065_0488 [Caldibacillus thermoamylovorans]|nr:hypothetical protein B4065_0488 [Caldibacillus thermoamylovorans]